MKDIGEELTVSPVKYFKWWEFKMDLTPCTLSHYCPVKTPCTICKEQYNSRPYYNRVWHALGKYIREAQCKRI